MPSYVYVSLQDEDKILVFALDPATGRLLRRQEVQVTGGPAPLAIDPARTFLYVGRRGSREITTFRIDPVTGGLSLIGTASLEGQPVFLATDRKGRFVLSAYYHQGIVAVHAVDKDGVVVAPPIEWLHTAAGAHAFQTDPSNRFAFAPHIAGNGPNAIFQFRFDEGTGRLTPSSPSRVSPTAESGPRHFCFHPSREIVYFSDEQGCSVTAYKMDSSGTLSPFQTVSTLPGDYIGENTCSQIQVTPSGRFLYAPNRGHDSIACFSIDDSTGRLTSMGQVPTEPVPRAFSLDPEGNFLFAAGLGSGRLASYRVSGESGELTPLETYDVGNKPMWVLTTKLPG